MAPLGLAAGVEVHEDEDYLGEYLNMTLVKLAKSKNKIDVDE